MRFCSKPLLFLNLLSSILILSCRGRQPLADSCAASLPALEGKAEHEQIGGYISVDYSPQIVDNSHWVEEEYVNGMGLDRVSEEGIYLQSFIARKKQGILNAQHCSAFFDFAIDKEDRQAPAHYEINFWTSKHCLAYPFVDKLNFFISTPQGFVEIPASKHELIRSQGLEAYLSIDPVFFSRLFLYFRGDMQRQTTAANLLQRKQGFLASDGLDEATAYSRNLCNSFRRDGLQVKPFAMDKACFNFLDLAVFSASIDLSVLNEAPRSVLQSMIAQQIQSKSAFYQQNPAVLPQLQAWHKLMRLQWVNGYKANLQRARSYVNSGCSSPKELATGSSAKAAGTFCDHKEAVAALEKEWQETEQLSIDLASNLEFQRPKTLSFKSLSSFNRISETKGLPGWESLRDLLGGYENLYLHWNHFDKERKASTYSSFRLDDFLGSTVLPPIWHEGGLALLAEKGTLPWTQGDSGAIVSYAGVIPVLSLSSVNDDETTGGRSSVALPIFQASEQAAFRNQPLPDHPSETRTSAANPELTKQTNTEQPTPYDEPRSNNQDEAGQSPELGKGKCS